MLSEQEASPESFSVRAGQRLGRETVRQSTCGSFAGTRRFGGQDHWFATPALAPARVYPRAL